MKKLQLGISTLFILLSVAVITVIINSSSAIFFGTDLLYQSYMPLDNIPTTTKLLLALRILAMLVFVYAVFIFLRAIIIFSKNHFFDKKLIIYFSKASFLFFGSGIMGFITSFTISFIEFRYLFYFNIGSRSLYIMLMIIGLFLMMLKRVLENGRLLKQENDLTI